LQIKGKKKQGKKGSADQPCNSITLGGADKSNYPPCQHCGKKGHSPFKCWRRPDVKCHKCQQLGHIAKICKNKTQQQQAGTQVADQQEQE